MPMPPLPASNAVMTEIRHLYGQVPTIDCKGLCTNSCGPIDMSDAERAHITGKYGVHIQPYTAERVARWEADEPLHCAALDDDGHCSIYEDRPLVCRLWGATETMICEYGCVPGGNGDQVPPGAVLLARDAIRLLAAADEIGGGPYTRRAGQLDHLLDDPEVAPLLERVASGDKSAEAAVRDLLAQRQPNDS